MRILLENGHFRGIMKVEVWDDIGTKGQKVEFLIAQEPVVKEGDGPLVVKLAAPSPPKRKDAWLAKIVGEDAAYTFRREFIKKSDSEVAEHFYHVFKGLKDGVYEAHTELRSGKNKRTFFEIRKGEVDWMEFEREKVLDIIRGGERTEEEKEEVDEAEERHFREYIRLQEQSEFVGLPSLVGSERQVRWGEKIRHDHIERLAINGQLTDSVLRYLWRYDAADWWISRKRYDEFIDKVHGDIVRESGELDKENAELGMKKGGLEDALKAVRELKHGFDAGVLSMKDYQSGLEIIGDLLKKFKTGGFDDKSDFDDESDSEVLKKVEKLRDERKKRVHDEEDGMIYDYCDDDPPF